MANAKRNITQLKQVIVLTRQGRHHLPPQLLKPFLAGHRRLHDRGEPHAGLAIALAEEGPDGVGERGDAVRVQLQAILQAAEGEGVQSRGRGLVTEKLFDGENRGRRALEGELNGHQSQALEVGDGATHRNGLERGGAEAVVDDWGLVCAFLACLVYYI
ncbi:hypothetical protein TIFTF001_002975 [Ficus carica]|uniref:Uncharacterized protein n=1 Tax=Ficus carica TaxID=3494 RepID=A0AA87Z9D4_FICCA|nr:hypothetical protein TIFTF001_002975 [Ficus carica]